MVCPRVVSCCLSQGNQFSSGLPYAPCTRIIVVIMDVHVSDNLYISLFQYVYEIPNAY